MFRPWGHLDWALGLSKPLTWHFVGCLGPEQRSIAAYLALAQAKILSQQTLLQIEEPRSPYAALAVKQIAERTAQYKKIHLNPIIIRLPLLSPIVSVDQICNDNNSSIILDITSLPKRYFFYILKRYFKSSTVKNLIVTYTFCDHYPSAPLTEDHDPWEALPTFRQPDPILEINSHRRLIVNVGFMPDGLVTHLDGRADEKQIELIIPFPAQVSGMHRAWQTVWALTDTPYKVRFNEHRVAPNDLSEAFDMILSLLPDKSNLISFAPFGPKPISAAMCLYASITQSPVYYAQPKIYRPNYSEGVATLHGKPQIFAYWIKHDGEHLFSLPHERRNFDKPV